MYLHPGCHYHLRLLLSTSQSVSCIVFPLVRFGEKGELSIKLQTPRQSTADDRNRFEHTDAHLEMYLHPGCHYHLRLLMSPGETLGQVSPL